MSDQELPGFGEMLDQELAVPALISDQVLLGAGSISDQEASGAGTIFPQTVTLLIVPVAAIPVNFTTAEPNTSTLPTEDAA